MSHTPHDRDAVEQSTSSGPLGDSHATRRTVLRAAGAGAGAIAAGSVLSGTAAAEPQIPTPRLHTEGNVLKDPAGNTVTLRGVNIIDPRRADVLAPTRGKNAVQMVDAVTDASDGWHAQVVRVPLQPSDIAETTTGYAQGPLDPGTFSKDDLRTYCEEHVDDVVDRCAERGVYCILDYHRHWTSSSADAHETNFDGTWANDEEGKPGPDDYKADLQQEVVDFWDVVADRYGDREHTFFEVYNEPTEPGMWGTPLEEGTHWAITWMAFVEFLQPAVDKIAEYTDNLQILGSPSWTQTPEGILIEESNLPDWADVEFRQFEEPENLAMSYHIYPGHQASAGEAWDDPTVNGQGVGPVYEEYPLFVTEFGWDNTIISQTLRGDTDTYGRPFFEWMEQSDAINYTAWCADIWWTTTVFDRAFEGTDSDISNPYTADVPQDCPELPCEWALGGQDVGTENSRMGKYLKDQLAEYSDHNNPAGDVQPSEPSSPAGLGTNEVTASTIQLEWEPVSNADHYNVYRDDSTAESGVTSTTFTVENLDPETTYVIGLEAENDAGTSELVESEVTTESEGSSEGCADLPEDQVAEVDGQTVCDVDGDGYFRDVTGDGTVGQGDVGEFFGKQHRDAWKQPELFDFSGNGEVTHGDVVDLADYVALN